MHRLAAAMFLLLFAGSAQLCAAEPAFEVASVKLSVAFTMERIGSPQQNRGPFQVIVADPPWKYATGNSLPYPTMSLDEIRALPVKDLSDQNAILWLWTTNTHLRSAFDVVEAWGFEYKTLLTWVKDRMGTGEWLRGQTEHCLLAARGKPVFLHGDHRTVLSAPRREHSRKPEDFYSLVEEMCPGAKLELFSRQEREGWRSFGDQAACFLAKL